MHLIFLWFSVPTVLRYDNQGNPPMTYWLSYLRLELSTNVFCTTTIRSIRKRHIPRKNNVIRVDGLILLTV